MKSKEEEMHLRSLGLGLLVAFALSAGCGPREGAGTTPTGAPTAHAPTAPVALAEYFKIARVGGFAAFSYDESLVAYVTDAGGRMDIWVAPVGGGEPRQVTHVEGFVAGVAFSPTEDALVYGADVGGNELPHLFLTNAAGTDPRDLNAEDPATARADLVRWADDGTSFLYVSNRREEKYLDLYEYVLATGQSERLWESSGTLAFGLPSRDHTRYAIVEWTAPQA